MKVEIWSDVVCPFCYIGKRKFEAALAQFEHKSQVQVEWKSFQLNPNMKTDPSRKLVQMLAEEKGIDPVQANAMMQQAAVMARQSGLTYHFEQAIPANTQRAHELLHFAKAQGKQDEAEEVLFRAHFTEGKNVDDLPTLAALASEIGLDPTAMQTALSQKLYAPAVQGDITEAAQLGVRGVPFFVFNRKYAISGAQDVSLFLETLQKSFAEWKATQPQAALQVTEGHACTPDGDCH